MMTPKEFFAKLERIETPFFVDTESGEIRQKDTCYCPILAVAKACGIESGGNKQEYDNACFNYFAYHLGLTSKFATMIVNAADNYFCKGDKLQNYRKMLKKACKL